MTPDIGIAVKQARAEARGRAERLEMLVSIGSQGLGDCPDWTALGLEDCERADRAPPRGRAMKE